MDLGEGLKTLPVWEQFVYEVTMGSNANDRAQAIDWYRELAAKSLEAQFDNGAWGRDDGHADGLIEYGVPLRRDLARVFPQLADVRIEHAWSGLMSYARHEMPQVGRIDEGLWLAQAFGGHGVAPTTFAGELLAAAIAEGDTRWRELCDYGLVSALKPAGFVGAQLRYGWLQALDAWKDLREGARQATT